MDATHDHRPGGTTGAAGPRSLKAGKRGDWLRWIGRLINRATTAGLLALIAIYKVAVSPLLGRHCRFQPTCSTYFREAVIRYGALRGSWRGLKRICRCHPWHPGGHDPP